MLRLLTLCLLLCPLLTWGQVYFNERYANNGRQSFATSVVPTDSGYVVTGENIIDPINVVYGLVFRVLDRQGQQVRVREYARPGYSYAAGLGNNLQALSDGSFVMAGACVLPSGHGAAMLWRFNAQGDTLWTRTYHIGLQSWAFSLCQTPDGGFALVGEHQHMTNQLDVLLLRTDSAGQMLWYQTYNLWPINSGKNITLTADGGFIIGGSSMQLGTLRQDAYVVKTDALGQQQWERRYGDGFWSSSGAVPRPTQDGGYMVLTTVGVPGIGGNNHYQPTLFKLNRQGQLLWRRKIGPAGYLAEFYVLRELADGSLVSAGQDPDTAGAIPGRGFLQGVVFKVCANGDSLWYRNYKKLTGGTSHNYLRDLTPTPDGGFVGSGFLHPRAPDTGTADAWVFKIDSAGYLQAGGAPVTAQCLPLGTTPETGAPDATLQLWPNPSADGLFHIGLTGVAELEVVDAMGRLVLRQVAGAEAEAVLDLSRQPAGVYGLRVLWLDGRAITRKLVR